MSQESRTPSDQAQRDQIRNDLASTILVEASAGTGKTTCIVGRMVNLIGSGECEIEQLAAMTFTRKAAAEMRERFYNQLRVAAKDTAADPQHRARCHAAVARIEHAYVGTFHAFCSLLIRERPVEFGVDPGFRELDETEDAELARQAWRDFFHQMHDSDDNRLELVQEYGLNRQDLQTCFFRFIGFSDVDDWPFPPSPEYDFDGMCDAVREYVEEMRRLQPDFPTDRGTDKLMNKYDSIVQRADHLHWHRQGEVFDLLEQFDQSHGATQKHWLPDNSVGKAQCRRWEAFRESVVQPGLQWWRGFRYQFLIELMRDAVSTYDRLREAAGGLSYQDLLLRVAEGLRDQPELRGYFQRRFSHLLVDEFQDTDPIQARILAYLASEDPQVADWNECRLRPGALFLVGDPKQSIYRFRRADIAIYRQMKQRVLASGGEVVPLVESFRSVTEVREWNNDTFADLIGDTESDYSPQASEMRQGREDQCVGEWRGVYRLNIDPQLKNEQAGAEEALRIARFIRHSIDHQVPVSRTAQELAAGCPPHLQPGDFLLVTWRKADLTALADALNRLDVPNDVTGASAFAAVDELRVLERCLQVVDDPTNPIPYVALLRSEVFGFSDGELWRYRQAGGRFNYRSLPEALEPPLKQRFQAVNECLQRYLRYLRQLPFPVAAERIAADLGLHLRSATAIDGHVNVGGMWKAIEWLRAESWRFDSARDMIEYLGELTGSKEAEPCSARPLCESVVRVMNLHKAKGLEAPVVFLAAPFGWSDKHRNVEHHVCRDGESTRGYLSLSREEKRDWGKKVRPIAQPPDWDQWRQQEERFLKAEANRLLYVAATRAKCMLIVSIRDGNNNYSGWKGLDRFLREAPPLPEPEGDLSIDPLEAAAADDSSRPDVDLRLETIDDHHAHSQSRWTELQKPSYTVVAAKEEALKGVSRPRWEASGEYGHRWGSAVHQLLEILGRDEQVDLQRHAEDAARQYELPVERLDELMETVQAVTRSELWQRSRQAGRRLVELPLDIRRENMPQPTLVRGVIDLMFEEPDGWVMADYKSDDVDSSQLVEATNYYRPQLDAYAAAWDQATGLPLKERGLYFTRIDRYVAVGPASNSSLPDSPSESPSESSSAGAPPESEGPLRQRRLF